MLRFSGMKTPFFFLLFLVLLSEAWSKPVYYRVEKDDQLGIIFMSIGHLKLWNYDGKVNLFKRSFHSVSPDVIKSGVVLRLDDEDIILKANVEFLEKDFFRIKKKIRTKEEFNLLVQNENIDLNKVKLPSVDLVEKQSSNVTIHSYKSFVLYAGAGGFVSRTQEKSEDASNSTFSGLQPIVQAKAIYSHTKIGSLSFDGFAKKIFTGQFSFPVNFDYRFQYLPIWNFQKYVRLAFSHSAIKHSYVGKADGEDKPFLLKSKFIGVGLVVPQDTFWYEFYFEKAYEGQMSSSSGNESRHSSGGYRFDTELVYPYSKKWRLIPGLNYYVLSDKQTDRFTVLEARLILGYEF